MIGNQAIYVDNCQSDPPRNFTLLNVPVLTSVDDIQNQFRIVTKNPNVVI